MFMCLDTVNDFCHYVVLSNLDKILPSFSSCLVLFTSYIEQSVISQYEDNLRFSEMALSSAISSMSEEGSADDEVICPICLK